MDIDLSKSIAGVQLDIVEALRHVVDGEFIPSAAVEYKGAHTFDLVTATDDIHPTAYIQNDAKFLYVAIDEVSPNSFMGFNIWKIGMVNISGQPQLKAASIDWEGRKYWDTLDDVDADLTYETHSRAEHSAIFEAAIGSITEFKIPLASLGVEAGDTIEVMFVFVEGGDVLVYPADADARLPESTYYEITLTEE